MDEQRYHYRAVIKSVYDGDTCTADIDLGLHIWAHDEKLRLYGINAPELRGDERPEGLKARDYLRSMIDGREVMIQTIKDKKGKYGRYLARIWLKDEAGNWADVNKQMVDAGHAVYKEY